MTCRKHVAATALSWPSQHAARSTAWGGQPRTGRAAVARCFCLGSSSASQLDPSAGLVSGNHASILWAVLSCAVLSCAVLCCAVFCHALCFAVHQIKNVRTQLAQRLREIRARVRIIISGKLGGLHHAHLPILHRQAHGGWSNVSLQHCNSQL